MWLTVIQSVLWLPASPCSVSAVLCLLSWNSCGDLSFPGAARAMAFSGMPSTFPSDLLYPITGVCACVTRFLKHVVRIRFLSGENEFHIGSSGTHSISPIIKINLHWAALEFPWWSKEIQVHNRLQGDMAADFHCGMNTVWISCVEWLLFWIESPKRSVTHFKITFHHWVCHQSLEAVWYLCCTPA